MRILGGLQQDDSCRDVFRMLKIPTVIAIYISEVVNFALNQGTPRNANIHLHYTRNAANFNLPPHRTARYAKKPSYAGARLYNLLPATIKTGNATTLKKRLLTWLIDNPIYTMEEFYTLCEKD